jgi:gliding motility-associated-like protein
MTLRQSFRLHWMAVLFVWGFGPKNLHAQCSNSPPHADNCENAPIFCSYDQLNGYCFSMVDYFVVNRPIWMCPGSTGGYSNWIGFYAECPDLDLLISFTNWTAPMHLKLAIYDYNGLCPDSKQVPDEILFCTGSGCINEIQNPSMELEVNLSGLVVGNVYYILVTGCSHHHCDVNFTVLSPSCGGGGIGPWPGDIEGPLTLCTGSSGTYSVDKPAGAWDLHWYLDGALIQEGTSSSVTIDWTTAGSYELCVDASNYCHEESGDPDLLCTTIVIQDLVPINPPDLTVCHDQTGEHDGMHYLPGVHTRTYINPLGCDSTITITVHAIYPNSEDLGTFYLCEGTSITVHGQTFTSGQPGEHSILTQQVHPPHCDSTIQFSIGVMHVEAFVAPPDELGCEVESILLDGSGSVAVGPPGTTIVYQWHASGGGVLGDPSDQPTMTVTAAGDYCLAIDVIAPDGSVTCSDTACVIVVPSADLSPAPIVSGPASVCSADTLIYALLSQGQVPPNAYVWVIPSGLNVVQPNDSTLLLIPVPGDTLTLCGYVTDECGDSPQTCVHVTIGQADTVLLSGQTCDPVQAGVFSDTLTNQAGCDSTVVRTIILTPELRDTLSLGTCDPAQVGVFADTLSSQQGCDSIVVRLITLLPSDVTHIQLHTCDAAQAGTDTLHLQNTAGCDSLVITTTALRPSYDLSLTAYTCDVSQVGSDTFHLQSIYGCDSIVVIETLFTGQYQENTSQIICGFGVSYSDTLQVTGGNCDSLFITDYVFIPTDTTLLTGTTCDATQAGTFTTILQNQSGCDSIITTTVALLPADSVVVEGTTCDPSEILFEVITLSNQYGCDSVVTRSIIWVGTDTTFIARTSCDSAQTGVHVHILPMAGAPCDSVVVETVGWAAQSVTILAETLRCEPSGPAADTLLLTSSTGCDSLVVRPYAYSSLEGIPEALHEACAGSADGQLALTAVSGSAPPWQYRLDSGAWQSAPVFTGLPPGAYTLTVQDTNGCTRSWAGLVIQPGEVLALDAGPDREVDPGALVSLAVSSPQALAQVQWSAADPLQCATCATTTLGPVTVSQWVTVQGWTAAGCSGTDQLEIRLKALENTGVFIPNSFSPNGDGINDLFTVYGNDQLRLIRQFAVYDRWGNALYLQRDLPPGDPAAGWDGIFRDRPLDPGVYVYAIELEWADGRVRLYKGDVQLLR